MSKNKPLSLHISPKNGNFASWLTQPKSFCFSFFTFSLMAFYASPYFQQTSLHEWLNEPFISDEGYLLLCLEGKVSIEVGQTVFHLSAGDVFIVFPADFVSMQHVTEDFTCRVLNYDDDLLRAASLNKESTVFDLLRNHRIYLQEKTLTQVVVLIFQLLDHVKELVSPQAWRNIVQLQLASFFSAFHDHATRQHLLDLHNKESRQEELVRRFMQLVESSYSTEREVAWYASQLCITPEYLNRVVRNQTHRTAKELIAPFLLMHVKHRLLTLEEPINQISSEFHFSSPSFFSRWFREKTGLTPNQFRKSAFSKIKIKK